MEDTSVLPPNVFGVTFQKACVTAAVHNLIPHLVRSMRLSGAPRMTEGLISFVAADCIGLWGIACDHRTRCFHCGRKSTKGVLCECVEGCLPRDFIPGFTRADVLLLGAHSLTDPAQTFICGECGQLGCTSLGDVLRATENGRTFYPHTRCARCQRQYWQRQRKSRPSRMSNAWDDADRRALAAQSPS